MPVVVCVKSTSVPKGQPRTHYMLCTIPLAVPQSMDISTPTPTPHPSHSSTSPCSGGTVDMAGVLIGVPVALVLLSLILTAVIYIGTLLCRTARQQERIWELPVGIEKSQVMSSTIEVAGGPYLVDEWEEDSTVYYNFDYMDEEIPPCISRARGSYQDLDEVTRDCSSVYDRLGRGSYQNLDSLTLEEAHRYQRFVGKRERHWERK